MRQILYFLIGFCISVSVVLQSYALECYDPLTASFYPITTTFPAYTASDEYADNSMDRTQASMDWNTFSTDTTYQLNHVPRIYKLSAGQYKNTAETAGYYWVTWYDADINYYVTYFPWSDGTDYTQVMCFDDFDGDGIPDDVDPYPDDPTPFSVKLVSYQTIDGTSDGEHVREVYLTDRGDYISIGADYDDNSPDMLVFNGTWFDGADIFDETTGSTSATTAPVVDQPTFTTSSITGPADDHTTDTTMTPGVVSTGSETDNQALQGIMDNTATTADNISKSGDYLYEINEALKNIDRNLAINNDDDDLPSEGVMTDEMVAAATAGETALADFDPTGGLSGVSGDLVEGVDYDVIGAIADETFVADFINSNPLKTVFDNSGFSYTGSACTAILDLGDMGTHELNICAMHDGFVLFGQLLVAFTTLLGLIHLATGRGF